MTAERWMPVVDFEGVYEISDIGRVRRVKPGMGAVVGRILRISLDSDGYENVHLSSPGFRRTVTVHRLVALAFLGVPDSPMEACHVDGRRTNNVLSNLRWGTHADNVRDTLIHGTHNQASKTHCAAGHAFDEANTRIHAAGRSCRACSRVASARYKAEKRTAA